MKKKIFAGIAVLTIALTMALNLNFSAKNNRLSDISLANIEALARGEGENGDCCSTCQSCNGNTMGACHSQWQQIEYEICLNCLAGTAPYIEWWFC